MRKSFCAVLILFFILATADAPLYGAYDPKGKRDPFVPLLTKDGQRLSPPGLNEEEMALASAGVVTWQVQGVVFDPTGDSYVILNGQIVREQETMGTIKILKIEPTQVTILAEGEIKQIPIRLTAEETHINP